MGKLLTIPEAAKLKGVATATLYSAVAQGRLPAQWVLNRHAVTEEDVLQYQPTRYAGRGGVKGRGGRPKGTPMSAMAKARISESQKRRWAEHKKRAAQR